MRTARDTAKLISAILRRSGHTRARISNRTIKLLGGRQNLRSAFVLEVIDEVGELGWSMAELNTGGYGVIQSTALEAARPVTAARLLTVEERRAIRRDEEIDGLLEEGEPQVDEIADDE